MYRIYACLILVLCAACLRAQDLIVTATGDSIRCVITSVGPYQLAYVRKTAEGKDRGRIALKDVASYKRVGYYNVVLGNVAERNAAVLPAGNKWMFTAGVGGSYLVDAFPARATYVPENYVRGLRAGFQAGAALHFFLAEHVAIGVTYSASFGARNRTNVTLLAPNGSSVSGTMADDIRLKWAGLNVLLRSDRSDHVRFNGSLGVGPLFYRNYATLIDEYVSRGTSFAFRLTFGADYRLTDALSIGAELGYLRGMLTETSMKKGSSIYVVNSPPMGHDNVDRIDAGVVLRMRL